MWLMSRERSLLPHFYSLFLALPVGHDLTADRRPLCLRVLLSYPLWYNSRRKIFNIPLQS